MWKNLLAILVIFTIGYAVRCQYERALFEQTVPRMLGEERP